MPRRVGMYVLLALSVGCFGSRKTTTTTTPKEEVKKEPSFPLKEDSKSAPAWGWDRPQRMDAQALYEAAPSMAHTNGNVALLCHFTFPAQMTFNRLFKATESVDPEVSIKFANGDSVSYYLGDNVTSAYLAVPVAPIANGDTLAFSIYEVRDVFKNEYIEGFSIPFAGSFPIQASNPELGISMECQASPQETIEEKLAAELASLDQTIEGLKNNLPINPTSLDGGYKDSGIPELIDAVEGAAAFVGWRDPRIQKRAEAVSQLLSLWDQRLKEQLAAPGEAITIEKTGVSAKLISTSNNFSTAEVISDAKLNATFEVENTSKKDVVIGFHALFLYNQLYGMSPQVPSESIKYDTGQTLLILKKGTKMTVEVIGGVPSEVYYNTKKEQLTKVKLFAVQVNKDKAGLLLIP